MILDIALPFYGDVAYLKASVLSVLNQSAGNWRLIVVDDGYPDPEVSKWFSHLNDKRVSYRRNEKNLGANGNYRRSLDFIENEYCVIMGADDIMLPNYVETITKALQRHPDVGIIHPNVEIIDENGNTCLPQVDRVKGALKPKITGETFIQGESLVTSLMRGNWMCFPAIVWRTQLIKNVGFREGLNVTQDLALAIDLIKQGGQMLLLNEILFQYRRHLNNDSAIRAINGSRFVEEKKLFKQFGNEFSAIGWDKAARSAKFHWSSRLHALSLLPKAIKTRNNPLPLLKHAVT